MLDYYQMIMIGAKYSKLRKKAREDKTERDLAKRFSKDELDEVSEDMVNLPHNLMRVCDGKSAVKIAIDLANSSEDLRDLIGKHPEFIIDAADSLRNRCAILDNRGRFHQSKDPRGFRDKALREVSEWASKRYGVTVSIRMVKSCIDKYATEIFS